MPSERECAERELKAFVAGSDWRILNPYTGSPESLARDAAANRYPVPAITRLREVPVGDWFVRWNNGHPEYRTKGGLWAPLCYPLENYCPEVIHAAADAKANPTEEVEE